MKITKLENSFIGKTYRTEIDSLPIQIKIYQHVDSSKDELVIHKREFKVLPKLKFKRGKETQIIISDKIIERIKITIPYTIKKEIVMEDCTKFHNDYIEYEVERKTYEPQIKEFINENLKRVTCALAGN